MRFISVSFLILSIFGFQMNGFAQVKGDGCKAYNLDVSAPLAAAKQEMNSAVASSVHYFGVPEMTEGRWSELMLHEQQAEDDSAIEWLVAPKKNSDFKGNHGGMASFTPKKDGKYFVAANSKVWLDFVDADSKSVVAAGSYEMQASCTEIFKLVKDYNLKAGRRYMLQVFSAPAELVKVYVGPQGADKK